EWLDEQRQLDHERLVLITETVDQLRKEVRKQTTVVDAAAISRGTSDPGLADGIPDTLADHVGRVERLLDEHIEVQVRTTQAENTVRDRERRQLAEIAQQIEVLSRATGQSTSRISALSEEIRHERDARAPVAHSVDELERAHTAIATRLSALELMVRRLGSTLSVVEVSDEKLQTGLARTDNQVKLVDLRVTREVAEVQRIVDEWRLRVDDQVKPVDSLLRQVGQLTDQRDAWQARFVAMSDAIERLTREQAALDNQAKNDRSAIQRGADADESLTRRLDSAGASIWQLGERLAGLVQELDEARIELQSVKEQLEAIIQRMDLAQDALQRDDATQQTLALELRTLRTDIRAWADGIEGRLDVDTGALAAQAEARYRLSLEHLRRSAEALNLQIRELETGLA
ncbi:MAG TPA: hypothetical protein VKT80_16510, partial [Chloroflexota bacterium]|nr:hypothetical protein [Chloroflexota bacterium]